jgi:hypothetical protein
VVPPFNDAKPWTVLMFSHALGLASLLEEELAGTDELFWLLDATELGGVSELLDDAELLLGVGLGSLDEPPPPQAARVLPMATNKASCVIFIG